MKSKAIAIAFIIMMFSCRSVKTATSISNKDSVIAEQKDSVHVIKRLDAGIIKTSTDESDFMFISFDTAAAPAITIDSTGTMHFTGVKNVALQRNKTMNKTDSSVSQLTDSAEVSATKNTSVKTHEKVKDKEIKSFTGFYIALFFIILLFGIVTVIYYHYKA